MSKSPIDAKVYHPQEVEDKIYQKWMQAKAFHAEPDARDHKYVIMMPLPNFTGALHMGHAMDNVMQDLLIRWHRMMGDNTLWMPGTDHAGIATQAVVEKRLKELEGKTRHDLGREALVKRIWAWKDKYQHRIISQLKRLGTSCDWDRARFTMDAMCARAVRHTFFKMFRDGLIFRGKRLVNWDVFLQTTISDDEVYHAKVQGYFWHLKYPVIHPKLGEPEWIEVATTRPETMLGDTAVAVHPDPEAALEHAIEKAEQEYAKAKDKSKALQHLESLKARRSLLPKLKQLRDMAKDGRMVKLPLMNRAIPMICDEWAKPELGSGVVKITPAHDPNDYEVWQRHKSEIEIINILNPDGTLNQVTGKYQGLSIDEAREKVVSDLKALGLLDKVEAREMEVGHSDRSKTPIQPYLSNQWFVRMKDVPGGIVMGEGTSKAFRAPGLVQAAMDAVTQGRIHFHPPRFEKTYLDWLSEKRDWPVSRQLWWGHRIPVFAQDSERPRTLVEALREAGLQKWIDKGKALLRVAVEGHENSIFIADLSEIPELPQAHAWVDVCLLEDLPPLIELLEGQGFRQEEDVLDTWFSSALWPHSTLGWPDPNTAPLEGTAPVGERDGRPSALDYYYPGSCLVTARDIITLWVARMVLTGLYNMGDIPFSDVFIHANILDGKGERMSKSKGNGIDPVNIIEEYGADALRFVLCDMQTGSQDIRLPVKAICPQCGEVLPLTELEHGTSIFTYICTHCHTEFDVLGTLPDLPSAKLISDRFIEGSRFSNKLWNTARFVIKNLKAVPKKGPWRWEDLAPEDRWILASFNEAIAKVHAALEDYNPSVGITEARDFMWNVLCDWYLEIIKPRLQAETPDAKALYVLVYVFEQTLRMLHPFVPFITEYIHELLREAWPQCEIPGLVKEDNPELIMQAPWPRFREDWKEDALRAHMSMMQSVVQKVRDLRAKEHLPFKQVLNLTFKASAERIRGLKPLAHVLRILGNIDEIQWDSQVERIPNAASFMVQDLQVFVRDIVDEAKAIKQLEKELKAVEKEIAIVERTLNNPKFRAKAPAHVVQQKEERRATYLKQKENILKSLEQLKS